MTWRFLSLSKLLASTDNVTVSMRPSHSLHSGLSEVLSMLLFQLQVPVFLFFFKLMFPFLLVLETVFYYEHLFHSCLKHPFLFQFSVVIRPLPPSFRGRYSLMRCRVLFVAYLFLVLSSRLRNSSIVQFPKPALYMYMYAYSSGVDTTDHISCILYSPHLD